MGQEACKDHVRMVQEVWKVHARNVQGACKDHVGMVQEMWREHARSMQEVWKEHARSVQGACVLPSSPRGSQALCCREPGVPVAPGARTSWVHPRGCRPGCGGVRLPYADMKANSWKTAG